MCRDCAPSYPPEPREAPGRLTVGPVSRDCWPPLRRDRPPDVDRIAEGWRLVVAQYLVLILLLLGIGLMGMLGVAATLNLLEVLR